MIDPIHNRRKHFQKKREEVRRIWLQSIPFMIAINWFFWRKEVVSYEYGYNQPP